MQSGVPLPQVVDPMQDLIDYTFEDPEVLVEAFVTFRVKLQNRGWLPEGNKRIAMIGDAVLRLVLVNDFYLGMASRGKHTLPQCMKGEKLTLNRSRRCREAEAGKRCQSMRARLGERARQVSPTLGRLPNDQRKDDGDSG